MSGYVRCVAAILTPKAMSLPVAKERCAVDAPADLTARRDAERETFDSMLEGEEGGQKGKGERREQTEKQRTASGVETRQRLGTTRSESGSDVASEKGSTLMAVTMRKRASQQQQQQQQHDEPMLVECGD